MKHYIFSLLLLFSFGLTAQEYDFVIDPIEVEVINPSMYELEAGNWTAKFHETYQYRDVIQTKLQRTVVVYIHDTAGKLENTYLNKASRNILGSTFTGEDFTDGHGHGTHVAGCVGGFSDYLPLGTAEMMAEKDKLWLIPHKVLTNSGQGNYKWVTESLLHAGEAGERWQKAGMFVIHNLSLGGSQPDAELQAAITKVRNAGQLVFIAAGNTAGTPIQYPGRANDANAIGAVDQLGQRASFSSYGKEMFLAGGGTNVLSTMPGGALAKMSGTSMATPTIVGFAAVLASIHPKATANQIERFLVAHIPGEWNQFTGYGIPKYSYYIDKDATKETDEPLDRGNEETDEQPTREKRELTFDFGGFEIFWKPMSSKFSTLYVDNIKLSYTTDYYDEYAHDLGLEEVKWFFTNRALVISDGNGFIDAGYWTAYFTEMLVNRRDSDLGIKIHSITVHDEKGRTVTVERKRTDKFKAKVNLLVNPGIYSFDYRW